MSDNGENQTMSIRKRRNLSKNRGLNARREKTPEPSRTQIPHEDTTTTDEEDTQPQRTSREIEADNTYEEMKRLVLEQANVKDPVYDLNTDEILVARALEANERRRRSISPFAIPDKDEIIQLERKLSFVDPTNKLLSTNYCVTLKDGDTKRRDSLTIDLPPKTERNIFLPHTSSNLTPNDKELPLPLPSTPKTLQEMVYPDEIIAKKQPEDIVPKEGKEAKKEPIPKPPRKINGTPTAPGELVTKVIQVERTPSKKIAPDQKPIVEVRDRIVRTPSRKVIADTKPTVAKQTPNKIVNEQPNKDAPVKPARSKSTSRFGNKTSESEMSEDQLNNRLNGAKRKVVPTPRRFIKNKSPRANRSNSVNRVDDVKVVDRTGTGMSQTSLEIIDLMQKARARSLSIPKDDPRLPAAYKGYTKVLQTPNKTPSSMRNTRGISCPKTIQIISDKEFFSGLSKPTHRLRDNRKHSRQSSGYVEASQSEYTSSCYTSSGSENEYEFDLSVKTAELTRKLHLLSKEVTEHEAKCNIILSSDNEKKDTEPKSVLRKRSVATKIAPPEVREEIAIVKTIDAPKIEMPVKKTKKDTKKRSRIAFIANWQEYKEDNKDDYIKLITLGNRCICDLFLLVIMCGLGGIMFKTLEGSFENAYKCSTRNVKRDFIENLWRGSHYLREEDWKSMARRKLHEFEDQLHTAHEAGVTSYSGQRSWNFMNSFVYCLTLVTTIGYGHIAPKTTYGRVATIVYAIIGIPLFLIVLADFGKLFTRIIKFFWAFIRRFYYTHSCRRVRRTVPVQEVMKGLNIVYEVVRRPSQVFSEEDLEGATGPPVERRSSDVPPPLPPKPGAVKEVENETDPGTPAPSAYEIDDEFNLPISVAIMILIMYIFIGAIVYNMLENWSFFESFYFVFISMSTIGLGDLVPDHAIFMMASILYFIFGLALTSMCINVVQVKLSDTFRQASAKLGATIGLRVAEEDGSLVPITPPPIEIAPVHKSKGEINTEEKFKDEETKEDGINR